MKKSSLLLLAVIFTISAWAQDTPITYTDVITVEGASKDELFIKARQWYNETFKDVKYVLKIDDKETGELAGKGVSTVKGFNERGKIDGWYYINYSVNIWVKEGKYKYEFSNLIASRYNAYSAPDEVGLLTSSEHLPYKSFLTTQKYLDRIYSEIKVATQKEIMALADNLKEKMISKNKADF